MFKAKVTNALQTWRCFWGLTLISTAATMLVCYLVMVSSDFVGVVTPVNANAAAASQRDASGIAQMSLPALEVPIAVRRLSAAEIDQHLSWANDESLARLRQQIAPIERVFQQARTSDFATAALSWDAKFLWGKDVFTNGREHKDFIEKEFKRCVLDTKELERLLAQCTSAYQKELDSIDGALLVRLQLDAEELPGGMTTILSIEASPIETGLVMSDAIKGSENDVFESFARLLISELVSSLVTNVVLTAGESSGFLSEKQANNKANQFAANVAVGMVVDSAINEATDPVGKMRANLDTQLNQLRKTVLDGTSKRPGIIPRLGELARRRDTARRRLVDSQF